MKSYKLFLILLLCVAVKSISAQGLQTTAGGIPVQDRNLSDVKGSQFIFDDWAKGNVKLKDDKVYNNLDLKYSDYDDAVYFKSSSGEMQAFSVPVADFTISYTEGNNNFLRHFKNGYQVMGYEVNAYFETLNDGKTQFLKKTKKKIEEVNTYGSTTGNKSFNTSTRYFIFNNGKVVNVKKDKKSILEALGDKQTELETYAKANNLNFKNEADIAKLVTYYNTI